MKTDAIESRLQEIEELEKILAEEKHGLKLSLRAREKLGKTMGRRLPERKLSKKPKKKKSDKASQRREEMLNAVVKFIDKHGVSKNRDIQEHLESVGLLKVGAPGNQPTLSRFLSKEYEDSKSPLMKDENGFVSLRK